jgi:hypothetical protein
MVIRNNKKYFFKYYTRHSAKLVLENCSRKWSSPLEFNDPFDNQFDLHIDEDSEGMAQNLYDQFIKYVNSDEPIPNFQSSPMATKLEILRRGIKNSGVTFTPEDLVSLREGAREGVNNAIKLTPSLHQKTRSALKDTSIFCMTETHDNLLMWAHYAQSHTGAVIKFLYVQEVDSPLSEAQEVRYSGKMPILQNEDIFNLDNNLTKKVINHITLTKGMDWAYEKEWRIVASMRDKGNNSEILAFAPEEIGAIYLGCKMEDIDRQEIIEITTKKYSKAEIYQAAKHEKEFKLIFERIH